MHYIIYKVTNKLSGKSYIGSHKTKKLDDGYMGSGTYLKRAINKYGLENFEKEILNVFDNSADMYSKEAEIVTKDYLMNENTYNMKVGGFGGFDYINDNGLVDSNSEESNLKRSETLKKKGIKPPPAFGNSFAKGNKTFFGKKHSDETKQKLRSKAQSRVGSQNNQYGSMWITNGVLNRKIKLDSNIPDGYKKGRTLRL